MNTWGKYASLNNYEMFKVIILYSILSPNYWTIFFADRPDFPSDEGNRITTNTTPVWKKN